VSEEPVEAAVVAAPEPIEPEPVNEVVIDKFGAESADSAPVANALPSSEVEGAEPLVSTEVEPASAAPAAIDEPPAAAAAAVESSSEDLPRTAGLFDHVPHPVAPEASEAAAQAKQDQEGEEHRA
jgi:ribonuclease E